MGTIRLAAFNSRAVPDVVAAVRRLESAGAAELVLDLRDNRGGLVQEGVELARLFLDGAHTTCCLCRLSGLVHRAAKLAHYCLLGAPSSLRFAASISSERLLQSAEVYSQPGTAVSGLVHIHQLPVTLLLQQSSSGGLH